jgi:hypothetical protein
MDCSLLTTTCKQLMCWLKKFLCTTKRVLNRTNSHQSSLNFCLTDLPWTSSWALRMLFGGMGAGINYKAYQRAIVVHHADYIRDQCNWPNGHSDSCLAFPEELIPNFIKARAGRIDTFYRSSELHGSICTKRR